MKEVPYTNNGKHPVHIGTKRIDPGQTRMVDATLVPGYKKSSDTPAAPADPLLELLDLSVNEIKPQLTALKLDDLGLLEAAERVGKTRKSLLAAIEEERLARAQSSTEPTAQELLALGEAEFQTAIADQEKVSNDLLMELYELESAGEKREVVLGAIAAEDTRRSDAGAGD